VPFLLEKRLVFVTGKGGVGKTTVSACLALIAARAGKRVIVCEVGEQTRLPQAFGHRGDQYAEVEIHEGIHSISIDPEHAMREYLSDQVGQTMSGLMTRSRIFTYLAAAAPGMKELLTIGKVWDLAQLDQRRTGDTPYDLVVMDAPATGHGLGMLKTPRVFRDVARVGPISRQAGTIDSFLSDPELTGVVAVAAPEEMPVNETVEFLDALSEEMGMKPDGVVVNGVYPQRFTQADVRTVEGIASDDPALMAARSQHRRHKHHTNQVRRLRRHSPAVTLPFLFESEIGLDALEDLSQVLEGKLA
jgi:anion-transporting  ArsA/GET3 family ATPase